eukprot:snap_masked-scaffold_5-processed-gene-4.19-mRNA-1 protein AED:1.00 eAED:1.00 QI:0/-1/0/0/-1/1/1/0/262
MRYDLDDLIARREERLDKYPISILLKKYCHKLDKETLWIVLFFLKKLEDLENWIKVPVLLKIKQNQLPPETFFNTLVTGSIFWIDFEQPEFNLRTGFNLEISKSMEKSVRFLGEVGTRKRKICNSTFQEPTLQTIQKDVSSSGFCIEATEYSSLQFLSHCIFDTDALEEMLRFEKFYSNNKKLNKDALDVYRKIILCQENVDYLSKDSSLNRKILFIKEIVKNDLQDDANYSEEQIMSPVEQYQPEEISSEIRLNGRKRKRR